MKVPMVDLFHREQIDKLLASRESLRLLSTADLKEDWINQAAFLLRIIRDAQLEVTVSGGDVVLR